MFKKIYKFGPVQRWMNVMKVFGGQTAIFFSAQLIVVGWHCWQNEQKNPISPEPGRLLLCKQVTRPQKCTSGTVQFVSRSGWWRTVQRGGGFVPGSIIWTGPAAPCAGGSEQPSVVRLPKHVEVCFDRVCGDRVLVQRVGGHFISGS